MKTTKKMRVLVVHTHERGEGSSITAVFRDNPVGRRKAKEMQLKLTSDNGIDIASLDEIEVQS